MGILSALRTPAQEEIADTVLQELRDTQKRRGELYQRGEALQRSLTANKQELGQAEYAGDAAAIETVQAAITKLERDLERNEAAQRVAQEKIADAERRLHLANVQQYLRTARKLANKRSKYATEASDALKVYLHARVKLQEANSQMVTSFPISGSEPPAGSVASLRELDDLMSRELLRLQGGNSLERLAPGTLANPFLSTSDLVPLADEIEQANKNYISAIEAPVGAVQPSTELMATAPENSASAPQPLDPDADLLSGRTFSIQDATALMSKTNPEVLIDNRKGAPDAQ